MRAFNELAQRVFTREQRVAEPSIEQQTTQYGHVEFDGRTHPIVNDRVWIMEASKPIQGAVAGNVSGLIETTHSPISLQITSSVVGKPTETDSMGYNQQIIGDIGAVVKEKHVRAGRYAQAVRKRDDVGGQLRELNANLSRVNAGNIEEAQKVLSQAIQTKENLNQAVEEALEDLRRATQALKVPDDCLIVRSLNGDITLIISDRETAVVVSNQFSHRTSEPEIIGEPPQDPQRRVEVFTYRGKIHVTYTPRN